MFRINSENLQLMFGEQFVVTLEIENFFGRCLSMPLIVQDEFMKSQLKSEESLFGDTNMIFDGTNNLEHFFSV